MIRKYRYLLTAAAAVGAAGLLTFAARNDFGLGRNMEIAVNMMRELSLNYVDPVDPDRLMEGAAAGMVSDLDPYTEYIPEEGMQDFELLTTGKYDGIGALIRQKDDYVRIAQPLPGIARRQGRAEDRRPRSSRSTARTPKASRPSRSPRVSRASRAARSK